MKTKPNPLQRPLINLLEYVLMSDDEENLVIQKALKALKMRPVWRKRKWRLVTDRR